MIILFLVCICPICLPLFENVVKENERMDEEQGNTLGKMTAGARFDRIGFGGDMACAGTKGKTACVDYFILFYLILSYSF